MKKDRNILNIPAYRIRETVGTDLLKRLHWMTLAPKKILNIGYDLTKSTEQLKALYKEAEVIACDFMHEPRTSLATYEKETIDLLVANLVLPWEKDMAGQLKMWREWLAPHGVLLFTMLGMHTAKEYHDFLSEHNDINLQDMHDVGDALLHLIFQDPVLEAEYYEVHYQQTEKLRLDLKQDGFILMTENTPGEESHATYTYEVLFAHTFKAKQEEAKQKVSKVPVASLRRKATL